MPGILEKTLPCKLSREEVEQRAQEMASLLQEVDEGESTEKERKKAAKKELEEKRGQIAVLAEEVNSGITRREVKCEEKRNNEAGSMEIIRLDDSKCWPDGKSLVSSRPLKPAEQQISLLDDHRRARDDEEGEESDGEEATTEGEGEADDDFDAEAALE